MIASLRVVLSWGLTVSLLSMAGCPALVSRGIPTKHVPDGIVYYLPMIELEVAVKRELLRCGFEPPILPGKGTVSTSSTTVTGTGTAFVTGTGTGTEKIGSFKPGDRLRIGTEDRIVDVVNSDTDLTTTTAFPLMTNAPYMGPVDPATKYTFKVAYSALVTPRLIPDTTKPLYIPYNKLNGAMKQTNMTFDLYDNGTLKSINAAITDKTDEVVLNLVKTGVTIAKMVGGIPSGIPAFTEGNPAARIPPTDPLCMSSIQNVLNDVQTAAREITKLSEDVEKREAVVLLLKQQTGSVPPNLGTELDGLKSAREKLFDKKNGLAKQKSLLSDEQIVIIKPQLGREVIDKDGKITIVDELLEDEVNALDRLKDKWFNRKVSETPDVKADVDNALKAYWGLYLPTVSEHQRADKPIGADQEGIIYRQSVSGEFMLCVDGPCLKEYKPVAGKDNRLYSTSLVVPQVGVLATLPVTNPVFGKNTLIAAFSPSGVLTKLTFTSEAAAATATGTMVQALPSISSLLEQKRGAETADINREKEKVKAQTELEKARKELDDARTGQ